MICMMSTPYPFGSPSSELFLSQPSRANGGAAVWPRWFLGCASETLFDSLDGLGHVDALKCRD